MRGMDVEAGGKRALLEGDFLFEGDPGRWWLGVPGHGEVGQTALFRAVEGRLRRIDDGSGSASCRRLGLGRLRLARGRLCFRVGAVERRAEAACSAQEATCLTMAGLDGAVLAAGCLRLTNGRCGLRSRCGRRRVESDLDAPGEDHAVADWTPGGVQMFVNVEHHIDCEVALLEF